MIEDKLTHDERLRLECLAQAVQLRNTTSPSRLDISAIEMAGVFEGWIRRPAESRSI